MATPIKTELGQPASEPPGASSDLQAVSNAEEARGRVASPSAHTSRITQKLLKALECSVRVVDQLATIGGADPLQASKDAEQFLLLLKDSHALAASMATKYALTAPLRRDSYVDQLELQALQTRAELLHQRLGRGTDAAMDTQ